MDRPPAHPAQHGPPGQHDADQYSQRVKDAYLWREGRLGEKSPSGDVGLQEVTDPAFVEHELKADRVEVARMNPNDLNDPGDPEAQDVGIPEGAGSGGETDEGEMKEGRKEETEDEGIEAL